MSITREDVIYEIFSFINSNDEARKVWDNKLKEIKEEKKYIESYELYCLAYDQIKLELSKKGKKN